MSQDKINKGKPYLMLVDGKTYSDKPYYIAVSPSGNSYAVDDKGIIIGRNPAIQLGEAEITISQDEVNSMKARKNLDTATPYTAALIMSQRDPYWRYKYGMTADLNTFNAVTGGAFNLLSPTQVGRNVYNFATGKPTAFNEFVFGNNGLFTDNYAKEHPYIAMAGNVVGDAFLGWSAARGFNPNLMALDVKNLGISTANSIRDGYYKVRYNAMPFDNLNYTFSTYTQKPILFRVGDVDVNRSLSSYRQLGAGGARNFLRYIDTDPHKAQYAPNANNSRKGLLARLNSDMPNPMYKQGNLWFGLPAKGFKNKYPDLLVTSEGLLYANAKSGRSFADQAGRRIPYSDSLITRANTNAYVYDSSYGYRPVGYYDGYQMPVTGNTEGPTVFYSRTGNNIKYFANKVEDIVNNAVDAGKKAVGADVYARNKENFFRFNAFADKSFYAEPVQEAITKTFEKGGQPRWDIFQEYKLKYPEYEHQFNNFKRTYDFLVLKTPYFTNYGNFVKNNDWLKNSNIAKADLSKDSGLGGVFLRKDNNKAIYLNDKSQLGHELEHWLQSIRDVDGNGSVYFPQQEKILNEAYIHSEGGIPEASQTIEKGAVNQQVREAIIDKYYREKHVYPHNETVLNKYIDSQTDATLKSILKDKTNAYGQEYVENNLDFSKIKQALKYVPAVGGIGFFGIKGLNDTK